MRQVPCTLTPPAEPWDLSPHTAGTQLARVSNTVGFKHNSEALQKLFKRPRGERGRGSRKRCLSNSQSLLCLAIDTWSPQELRGQEMNKSCLKFSLTCSGSSGSFPFQHWGFFSSAQTRRFEVNDVRG